MHQGCLVSLLALLLPTVPVAVASAWPSSVIPLSIPKVPLPFPSHFSSPCPLPLRRPTLPPPPLGCAGKGGDLQAVQHLLTQEHGEVLVEAVLVVERPEARARPQPTAPDPRDIHGPLGTPGPRDTPGPHRPPSCGVRTDPLTEPRDREELLGRYRQPETIEGTRPRDTPNPHRPSRFRHRRWDTSPWDDVSQKSMEKIHPPSFFIDD